MNTEYRRLTSADAALALTMNTTIREGFFTPDTAAAFLRRPENMLFAAVQQARVIGFAYGYELLRPDGRRMLYIHEVGVTPAHHRQGVATAMLSALMTECRAAGICRCFLFTAQQNAAANALYRKLGGETGWESHGNDTAWFFQLTN